MTRTTLEDYEPQEVEVTREGYKWEEKYATWETVKVEKEGLVCDCCPRLIGPVDDPEPHATLAANPRQYIVDLRSREPINPFALRTELREKLVRRLHSSGTEIKRARARIRAVEHEHDGFDLSVDAEGGYSKTSNGLFLTLSELNEVVSKTLEDEFPESLFPSDDIHTDGELHFCEECAEEFDVPLTTGVDLVERDESERETASASDESDGETAATIASNGVDNLITGTVLFVGSFAFSHAFPVYGEMAMVFGVLMIGAAILSKL